MSKIQNNNALYIIPVNCKKVNANFDLPWTIIDLTKSKIQEGDVIVLSSKFVAYSQNRILDINKIKNGTCTNDISKKYQIKEKFAEIIIRESDEILGGVTGFVIASSNNILSPNAGIDKSNVKKGKVILYPENSFLIAEELRRKIFLELLIHVGVIIIDSRLMPARVGTTGIAIGCAGIEPTLDKRAQKDLDGNPLKVTYQATADSLATIANHIMGEGDEAKPIVIIRNSNTTLTDRKIHAKEMTISSDQCVFMRSFRN